MIFSNVIINCIVLALVSLSSQNALAYEVLESRSEVLETFMADEVITKTVIDFEVVKVQGVPTFTCDEDPDDPICEFYGFYYDKASYSYIKTKTQMGFTDDFYPLDGSIEEVALENAKNGEGLEDGVVILYKVSGDPIGYKQLMGFLKKTSQKYIK